MAEGSPVAAGKTMSVSLSVSTRTLSPLPAHG